MDRDKREVQKAFKTADRQEKKRWLKMFDKHGDQTSEGRGRSGDQGEEIGDQKIEGVAKM